jgi:disulfide bond formation protein DsbB
LSYAAFSQSAGTLALLAALAGLGLLLLLALPGLRRRLQERLAGEERSLIGLAWGTAAVATAGSLYYSEVAGLVPCVLCWYQRIAMYPLVLVLGVAFVAADRRVWRYGLPLSLVGLVIAAYHVLIQFQPALDAGTCSAAAPCTARYVAVYGFVSIPVMAGSGFLLLSALLLTLRSVRSSDAVDPPGKEDGHP